MSGKWHCGEAVNCWPVNRGFDRYFGLLEGAANYFNPEKGSLKPRTLMRDREVYDVPAESFYMTDAVSECAVRFLDEYASEDRPFFLYLPYTAPHAPLQAWPEDIERFRGDFADGWDILRRRYERRIDEGIISRTCALSPRDDAVNSWRLAEIMPDQKLLAFRASDRSAMIAETERFFSEILSKNLPL